MFWPKFRKYCRLIHRDVSFFFSGMVFIYAISGIVMNHRDSINPNYTVERIEFTVNQSIPPQSAITKADVLKLLAPLKEDENYTKHYFPKSNELKVFLKGGSNYILNLDSRQVVYEKISKRPILSSLTRLHYNPGSWWTIFADIFAIGLILITLTGWFMLKGSKGFWGRGCIELLAGIAIPLLFLFL